MHTIHTHRYEDRFISQTVQYGATVSIIMYSIWLMYLIFSTLPKIAGLPVNSRYVVLIHLVVIVTFLTGTLLGYIFSSITFAGTTDFVFYNTLLNVYIVVSSSSFSQSLR